MASKTYMKPTIFKAGVVRGFDSTPEISREGGEFGAGFIKNFAVITAGPALGHGAWVDSEFVNQVANELAAAKKGIKSRYTHPNQCGDSLSKGLGRVFYRADGDGKVRGDLHFWKAAHNTPDGNLAGFLIDLAEDDPEAFGSSISFMRDPEAEEQFAMDNPTSPDPANTENHPHVRLGKLRFVDIVDEPAANPDGLFHRGGEVSNAESIMEYALGLRDEKPSDCETIFGIESDRLLNFVSNFLNTRGLSIVDLNNETPEVEVEEVEVVEAVEVAEVVTEEVEAVEAPCCEAEECECEEAPVEEAPVEEAPEVAEVPVEEVPEVEEVEEVDPTDGPQAKSPNFSKEELGLYIENFGKEAGLDFFMEGLDFAAAQAAHIVSLKSQIEAQKAQIELSEETESQPLSGNNGEAVEVKGNGFKVTIK